MTAASPADPPRTYGDLRRWGDDTRWELVDGQAYAMTGPSWQHQSVTMGLASQLLAYFRAHGCRVLPAPFDVRLPRGDEPDDDIETTVQPDISVVCDIGKLDERGCRGAPDLVVEVLSSIDGRARPPDHAGALRTAWGAGVLARASDRPHRHDVPSAG